MVIITAILINSGAVAQEDTVVHKWDFNRSEFSIQIGGGASNLQNLPTIGKELWSWTGTAGLGYHYFFNPQWGVVMGANFAVYNRFIFSVKNKLS